MKKVLLISMPFGALERQSLGISLLKAKLNANGQTCNIGYLNFIFADFIGFENYKWFSVDLPYTAFAGDWLFTEALYGERHGADQEYIKEVLVETWQLNQSDIARLFQLRKAVVPFLRHCLQHIKWSGFSIVGFTSTFEQNIASLALAKGLKAHFPSLIIVFGGANWESEMGIELHKRFPFVDYAFSGEADENFPEFVKCLSENVSPVKIAQIPGIIYRTEMGETLFSGKSPLVAKMDELPIPDFSDYFQAYNSSTYNSSIVPSLLLETSRGCWWGEKKHCTFCGLNGGSMAFRSKSAQRVLDEVNYLSDTWKVTFIEFVDNILDMHYFQDLIPNFAENPIKLNFFFEVKANLNRKHIELMHKAGINHIQPGIESMNDNILRLMSKGTTALQNIQLLRLCKEYGITASWNILYGFPGETHEDYCEMLSLLKSMRFLYPPHACGPVRLDRFSPYFNTPEKFGMKHLIPINSIRHIYPFPLKNLMNISYYFDFEYEEAFDPRGFANDVIAYSEYWKKNPEIGQIDTQYLDDDALILTDSRSDATIKELQLRHMEKSAYEYCDGIRTITSVVHHLEYLYGRGTVKEEKVKAFLDSLVGNNLMVCNNGRYLSLAIGLKNNILDYTKAI